jgi:uncharacterized protein (TIGR03435 family)
LRRLVFDRTGLEGNYEFELDFNPGGIGLGPSPPDGPSVFEALQDLGLKLEPSAAPIQVMARGHLERAPIDN